MPPATPTMMKEQDEVRGRRESQAKARKNAKDVISAKAKQRLAQHVKYVILAHTKRSLEKLVKHLFFPIQKKGNDMFSLKNIIKYGGLREGKQRLEKFIKIRAFRES